MNAPWFDPNFWAWLPGTALGCTCGIWGGLAGFLAPKGKSRSLVFGGGIVLLGLAMISGVAGVVALIQGQPYGVWYGLLLPGVIGGFLLPFQLPLIHRAYGAAERRKMTAEDL